MTTNDSVTIEVAGRFYSGVYSVADAFLRVTSGDASTIALRGSVQPRRLARMLLRQIVLEQKRNVSGAP